MSKLDASSNVSMSQKIEEKDWIAYMDMVATLINVKPNLTKVFFTNHKLWWKLVFDPVYPYQYRIHGHGRWKKAADAIFDAEERNRFAINNNNMVYSDTESD